MLEQLKAAAERCDGYLVQYGVELMWHVTVMGLLLTARCGADKVERTVYWSDYDEDQLQLMEKQALAGLSS